MEIRSQIKLSRMSWQMPWLQKSWIIKSLFQLRMHLLRIKLQDQWVKELNNSQNQPRASEVAPLNNQRWQKEELWRLSFCHMRTWTVLALKVSSWCKSWNSRRPYSRIMWLASKKTDLYVHRNSIWNREIMSQRWLNSQLDCKGRRI